MEIKKSEIKRWAIMGPRATFGIGVLKLYEEEPDFLLCRQILEAHRDLQDSIQSIQKHL